MIKAISAESVKVRIQDHTSIEFRFEYSITVPKAGLDLQRHRNLTLIKILRIMPLPAINKEFQKDSQFNKVLSAIYHKPNPLTLTRMTYLGNRQMPYGTKRSLIRQHDSSLFRPSFHYQILASTKLMYQSIARTSLYLSKSIRQILSPLRHSQPTASTPQKFIAHPNLYLAHLTF